MKSGGFGDTITMGPEAEFFVFDDVRFSADPYNTGFKLDSTELPSNMDTEYETGNLGHRPRTKGGYFPVPPIDSAQDMRSEMLSVMTEMGVTVEKHHHEVAAAQHELGLKFETLTKVADSMQIYKYVVHQVANAYGKTATFMPKPVFGDNGTGMHVHQSIWKDGQPTFAGNLYADLSENCLFYIGGILKHAKALNAFTNPSTNSYKRLVPGYEAPVLLAYSARNRSASCRIPIASSPKGKRLEVRFPDPAANPYLAYAAMCMAGLDGIKNRIHPGDPMDKDLYDLPPEELAGIPTVCGSLREALAVGRCRPRVPEGRRRVRRRSDRCLHRAEDGGEHALRDDAAPGRVRPLLLGLIRDPFAADDRPAHPRWAGLFMPALRRAPALLGHRGRRDRPRLHLLRVAAHLSNRQGAPDLAPPVKPVRRLSQGGDERHRSGLIWAPMPPVPHRPQPLSPHSPSDRCPTCRVPLDRPSLALHLAPVCRPGRRKP